MVERVVTVLNNPPEPVHVKFSAVSKLAVNVDGQEFAGLVSEIFLLD